MSVEARALEKGKLYRKTQNEKPGCWYTRHKRDIDEEFMRLFKKGEPLLSAADLTLWNRMRHVDMLNEEHVLVVRHRRGRAMEGGTWETSRKVLIPADTRMRSIKSKPPLPPTP